MAEVMLDALCQVDGRARKTSAGCPRARGPFSCRTNRSVRTSSTCLVGRRARRLRVRTAARGQSGPGAAPAQLGRSAKQDRRAPNGRLARLLKDKARPTRSCRGVVSGWLVGRPAPTERERCSIYIAEQKDRKAALRRPALGDVEYEGVFVQSLRSLTPCPCTRRSDEGKSCSLSPHSQPLSTEYRRGRSWETPCWQSTVAHIAL